MGEGIILRRGGGTALNFKIVGSVNQPTNAAQNTIWINTANAVTCWAFGFVEPEDPVDGMIWISTGINGTIKFNALKRNQIIVYPITAMQYVSGEFAPVEMMIYQDGEWKFTALIIVPNAHSYGGDVWITSDATMTVDDTQAEMVNTISAGGSGGIGYSLIPVDLTAYTTLKIVGTVKLNSGDSGGMSVKCGMFSAYPESYSTQNFTVGFSKWLDAGSSTTIDNTYDVSAITGVHYFGCFNGFSSASSGSRKTTFTLTSVELS